MAARVDFYSTSAQVLPLLLVVAVFEAQRVGTRITPALDLGIIAVIVLFIVAGETAALHVTSTGKDSDGLHTAVILAYGVAGLGIYNLIGVEMLRLVGLKGRLLGVGLVTAYVIALLAFGIVATTL